MAEEPTGFLDLPPEIRNEIYALLLPNNKKITIRRRLRSTTRIRVLDGFELRDLLRMLRANRQIYAEAAPMAYGAVTFKLCVSASVVGWLKTLGSMKQHLRHVHLESWLKTYMRSLFHQLKQARFLQTVTLNGGVQWENEAGVAEALRPFIQNLKGVQDGEKSEDHAREVVRVEPLGIYKQGSSWQLNDLEKTEQYNARLQSELKKLVA